MVEQRERGNEELRNKVNGNRGIDENRNRNEVHRNRRMEEYWKREVEEYSVEFQNCI